MRLKAPEEPGMKKASCREREKAFFGVLCSRLKTKFSQLLLWFLSTGWSKLRYNLGRTSHRA